MTNTDYTKLINSCEESIEYENHNQILLNIGDWYLMKYDKSHSSANSYTYHRGCAMVLKRTPFLHWSALKCRGCGMLPPDGMAGAYSLHNMEHRQEGLG